MDYTKDHEDVKTDGIGCLVFVATLVVIVVICLIFGL